VGPVEGREVGLVGLLEGCPVGCRVGLSVGILDGRLVGLELLGLRVGGFVSPGRVGREVTGTCEGREEGAVEVGFDVGALMSRYGAVTKAALRMSETEFKPGPSSNWPARRSFCNARGYYSSIYRALLRP
jgi:hypothetical protein